MDEATPADVVSIVAELARPLAASGFDLVAPLQASWYNEEPHIAELPAAHKLPARRADQLALLVANTRALWKPFWELFALPLKARRDNRENFIY